MKQKKEKRLRLCTETIQNLDMVLDREDQKKVNGGSESQYVGTTQVPVFC